MTMAGVRIGVAATAVLASIVFAMPGRAAAAGKFEPPESRTLLLVGQNKDSVEDYIKEIGTPAGFMLYTSIQGLDGLSAPCEDGAGVTDGQHFVDKYPDTVLQIGLYMVGALDGIPEGAYDRNINRLGRWISVTRRPVFLRIGYEFDLPANDYDPQKYVKAYRYIVDRLRENKVENVSFVWHSCASFSHNPPSNYYPGDDYVDWIGVSFFDNFSNVPMKTMLALAKEHGKPLMLAEATPRGIGAGEGKRAYYRWYWPLFRFVERNDVKMLCYINTDWDSLPMFSGQDWKDSRVQSDEEIRKVWLEETGKIRYLKSSRTLYETLGYTLPPPPPADDSVDSSSSTATATAVPEE